MEEKAKVDLVSPLDTGSDNRVVTKRRSIRRAGSLVRRKSSCLGVLSFRNLQGGTYMQRNQWDLHREKSICHCIWCKAREISVGYKCRCEVSRICKVVAEGSVSCNH